MSTAPLPPDDNLGPGFVTLTAVLTVFSASTTALRLWARGAKRQLGLDDLTIGLTAFLALVRMAVQIWGAHEGFGRHKAYLSAGQYIHVSLHLWITQIILFCMVALMKSSICLLMLRIDNNRWLKYILYTVIVGLVISSGECIIILLSECRPIYAWWDRSKGKCWPTYVRVNSIYAQVGMYHQLQLHLAGIN